MREIVGEAMRTLTRHQINDVNGGICIVPGELTESAGGGCHTYSIAWGALPDQSILVRYQKGPLGEVGHNGLTDEALLVIVLDRLEQFQKGGLANRHTALAATAIEQGLMWLQERTRDRLRREVEGTYEK
jgi:hypothetical protein